jgi:hypothetical protein
MLILVGLLFVALPFVGERLDLISTSISVAVLPLALGIDLVREAVQRRRATRPSLPI